jgi:hypothetical protein
MNKNIVLGVLAFGGLVLLVSLTGGRGEEPTPTGELPAETIVVEDAFQAFPMYAGELESFRMTEGNASTDASASIVTTDSESEVYEWYRRELSSNGWGIKSDKNVAGYQIVQAENANLYTSLQTATGAEGTLVISQQMKIRR